MNMLPAEPSEAYHEKHEMQKFALCFRIYVVLVQVLVVEYYLMMCYICL